MGHRPTLEGLRQRHRLAAEEIGQDRAAVREVAFRHGVQEARCVLRDFGREALRDVSFDDLLPSGRDEWDRLAEGLADDSGHLAEAERLVRVEVVALVAMARVGQQLGVRLGEIGDGGIGRLAFGAERMQGSEQELFEIVR
jgi:hypothetical protein